MTITIAICSYNRSAQLQRLLRNILTDLCWPNVSQKDCPEALLENYQIDFLVVDNNSTDDTATMVKLAQADFLAHKAALRLQYCCEKKQGLSHARNRAILETQSDWLIFTDDDVLLDSAWLQQYCVAMKQTLSQAVKTTTNHISGHKDNAAIDFIGGRILLNWLKPKPQWLQDEDMPLLRGVLGKFDYGELALAFSSLDCFPCGASFAVSRRLLQQQGGFNTEFGVVADKPGRGEETEYFMRAAQAGFVGLYCGAAVCFHDALVERLNTSYLLKHGFEKGRADSLLNDCLPHNEMTATRSAEYKLWIKACWQLLSGRRDRYLQGIINIGMIRGVRDIDQRDCSQGA